MPSPKLHVAICGGGIAGLTTALALCKFSNERRDIKIDVYEANTELTEIGAGIGMWLRPWKILCDLGLEEDLKALLDRPFELSPRAGRCWECRKADQVEGISFYEFVIPIGLLGFHRTQFLKVLSAHLDHQQISLHYTKRLASYAESGSSVVLSFTDGSSSTADVLIGCDGINSRIRKQMLMTAAKDFQANSTEDGSIAAERIISSIEPVWTGLTMYRNVVPRDRLVAVNPDHRALSRPVFYTGKGKVVVTYPIQNGKAVNVGAVSYDLKDVGTIYKGPTSGPVKSESEVLRRFEGYEDELQQILSSFENTTFWVINQLNPLPFSTRGRVAVLGDAAHAMGPMLGSGAGQAIEDAYVLGALLAHPNTTCATLQTALKIYEAVRLPHANEVMRRSARSADISMFMDPQFAPLADVPPEQLDVGALWDMGHALISNWKWAWATSIDGDLTIAINMLKEQTGTSSAQV